MKKVWKISIITIVISLVAFGSYLGINYIKYDDDISSSDNILTGQISKNGLFLTDDNTVRDSTNNIVAENISFINEDGLMVDTTNTLVGYDHIKRVKDVKFNYYIDSDDNLYRYGAETKRLIEKDVKFIESIKFNGTNKYGIVSVTKNGKITLFSDEQDTSWFDKYVKSLSFGQKFNISKISINYYSNYYNQNVIDKRIVFTLFENGQLLKTTIDSENKVESNFIDDNIKIKDFVTCCETNDYIENMDQWLYLLTNDNEVFYSQIFAGGEKNLLENWTNIKGIYYIDNILYGVCEDNTFYSTSSIEGSNLLNIEEIYKLDAIIFKKSNGELITFSSEIKHLNILSNDVIDWAINNATDEYALVKNNNTGWYFNGDELKQIEGEFQSVTFYENYFYFVTTDGKIKSTYRFSNFTLTSQENVKEYENEVILFNDGTVSTISNDSNFIGYLSKLTNIEQIGYSQDYKSYWFKNKEGRLYLYSMINGNIENLTSFPQNDWDFVCSNDNRNIYLFYSKKEDKNIMLSYNKDQNCYEFTELDLEYKIIQVVTYNYSTYALTTKGRVIKNFDITNLNSNKQLLYGLKLLDTNK